MERSEENITGSRLYLFYVIDSRNGRDQEGEQMLRQFMIKGHKIENLFIFTSNAPILEIHSYIKENKLKDFMYFLIDMTNNISDDTFKTIMNENYFRHAGKLAELFKEFKTDIKTITLSPEEVTKKIDAILDQIIEKGEESLRPEQKQFLENFNKNTSFNKK